jgi:hypothetical protein
MDYSDCPSKRRGVLYRPFFTGLFGLKFVILNDLERLLHRDRIRLSGMCVISANFLNPYADTCLY